MSVSRELTVLIKPASGNCNMSCRYCFYHDVTKLRKQENMGMMSELTMQTLIDRAISYVGEGGKLNFIFQGGEPTLCGREFFEDFIAYTKEATFLKSYEISYGLQTNGLLLDDRFCEFLAKESFLVGLSLDGPADLHDINRVDRQGKGTFGRVLETSHRLSQHGVAFNIVSVITRPLVGHPQKIYSFFKRNGFTHVQLIPCIEAFDATSSEERAPDPVAYGFFLCQMFDLWVEGWEEGTPLSIREFDNFASLVLFGREFELCSMGGICSINAIVETDGSVYPCDFYALDQWKLGNIYEADFEEILDSECARNFIDISYGLVEVCQQCQWLQWCRGGCRRLREGSVEGELSLFRWCEGQKLFVPHALASMNRLALAIRRQQDRNR